VNTRCRRIQRRTPLLPRFDASLCADDDVAGQLAETLRWSKQRQAVVRVLSRLAVTELEQRLTEKVKGIRHAAGPSVAADVVSASSVSSSSRVLYAASSSPRSAWPDRATTSRPTGHCQLNGAVSTTTARLPSPTWMRPSLVSSA